MEEEYQTTKEEESALLQKYSKDLDRDDRYKRNFQLQQDYRELLKNEGCGRHALNNFFMNRLFIKEDQRLCLTPQNFRAQLGIPRSTSTSPFQDQIGGILPIPLKNLCNYLKRRQNQNVL